MTLVEIKLMKHFSYKTRPIWKSPGRPPEHSVAPLSLSAGWRKLTLIEWLKSMSPAYWLPQAEQDRSY